MWNMAGEAIVNNIVQVEAHLPIRDEADGDFEYLGKMYRLIKIDDVVSKDGNGSVNNELKAWEDDYDLFT